MKWMSRPSMFVTNCGYEFSRFSTLRQSYSVPQYRASFSIVASGTPCELSGTVSCSGNFVALMRRRKSDNASFDVVTLNGRNASSPLTRGEDDDDGDERARTKLAEAAMIPPMTAMRDACCANGLMTDSLARIRPRASHRWNQTMVSTDEDRYQRVRPDAWRSARSSNSQAAALVVQSSARHAFRMGMRSRGGTMTFHTHTLRAGLGGLVLLATIAVAAATSARVSAQVKAGDDTTQAVRKKLERLPYFGVFDWLAFGVDRGRVRLVGYSFRPSLKTDAEMAVKQAAGVDEVV